MQQHLVASWSHWIHHPNGRAEDNDHHAALAQLQQNAEARLDDFLDEINGEYQDMDDDFFAPDDCDGNDLGVPNVATAC